MALDDELRQYLGELVNAAVAQTIERAPIPTTQSATVQSVDAATGLAQVKVDGDAKPSVATNVSGAALGPGARVQVLFMPPHAAMVIGLVGGSGTIPVGTVFASMNSELDDGYLWCNGDAIPTEHGALIAMVGANTPDLRDRVLVGHGAMGGAADAGLITATLALGTEFGAATHVLGTAEMPSHSHNLSTATGGGGAGAVVGAGTTFAGGYVANAGSGTAHNNVQPSTYCNVIIKF